MKKRKKLSLSRETLRVETFMGQVVGGYQSQQCNHTDIGPDTECALCGPGPITRASQGNCSSGAGCEPTLDCSAPTVDC